ncbi:MAG TPA: SAF domain-containing protein, partial [Microbacterium sp.]|nr:SAF domain-containing protein [Microbacterium sp.]
DADFSLTPAEFAALVTSAEQARVAVQSGVSFGPTEQEKAVLALRRSLYVVADVRRGEPVTAQNVRSIRPAGGLAAVEFDRIAGRVFTQDVRRGTPLTWDVI